MMAICPVGPPKLMKPSLTQKRKASAKVGWCAGCSVGSEFMPALNLPKLLSSDVALQHREEGAQLLPGFRQRFGVLDALVHVGVDDFVTE